MNLLIIADPYIPIPPEKYGGSERIIHLLCEGLQKRGHIVNLLAAKGSKSYGGQLFIHHAPSGPGFWRGLHNKFCFQRLSLSLLQDIDVIINHGRVDYLGSMTRTSIPLLCQFHTAIHQSDIDFVLRRRKARKKVRFVGVSQSHIEHVKPSDMIDVIYNGVDTERFVPVMQITKKYLAFLGRLTPDKGVEQAIQVARLAGIPLKIAGNSPDNRIAREYFEQSIKPHLGKGCEWIGPVNDRGKNELLGGAIAMLFPIQCGEPFGIVMIESLACGTPVIASRIGSTPEVIRHGKTGFLCDSVDDMVEAVKRIGEIDRRDCRSDVESRFSADIMVEQNLKVIEKILNN